jgi:hypothetical protein
MSVGRELPLVFSGLRLRQNQRMWVRQSDRQRKQVRPCSRIDLRIDKVAPIRRPALWNRQCMRWKQEFFGCRSVRGFSINSLRPVVGDVTAIGRPWGRFPFRRRNAIWVASSGFDRRSMIKSGSSPVVNAAPV